MDDARFNGKKLYPHPGGGLAVYTIRGNELHRARTTGVAEYQVKGNFICKFHSGEHAFEIKGYNVYKLHQTASQAIYEIRE